jgi:hypothetical protein
MLDGSRGSRGPNTCSQANPKHDAFLRSEKRRNPSKDAGRKALMEGHMTCKLCCPVFAEDCQNGVKFS